MIALVVPHKDINVTPSAFLKYKKNYACQIYNFFTTFIICECQPVLLKIIKCERIYYILYDLVKSTVQVYSADANVFYISLQNTILRILKKILFPSSQLLCISWFWDGTISWYDWSDNTFYRNTISFCNWKWKKVKSVLRTVHDTDIYDIICTKCTVLMIKMWLHDIKRCELLSHWHISYRLQLSNNL